MDPLAAHDIAQITADNPSAYTLAGTDTWLVGREPCWVVETPGHAPDHLAFVAGHACFTGDAVLGEGSVFVAPDPGALRGYLEALRRLRDMDLQVLCPGHGPLVLD